VGRGPSSLGAIAADPRTVWQPLAEASLHSPDAGAIPGSHLPGLCRHRQACAGTTPQPDMPADLHECAFTPITTAHGKEKVYGSIP
jgi:hypothetical protein